MEQVIFYGAGTTGQVYYDLLKEYKVEDVVNSFCDQNIALQQSGFCGKKVISYAEAKEKNLPFFVTLNEANNSIQRNEIVEMLQRDGQRYMDVPSLTNFLQINASEFHRLFCAQYHVIMGPLSRPK